MVKEEKRERRVNLTFEEWKEVGDMFKHLRGKLVDFDFKGMTKKAWRKHPVTKAKKHLDRLKNELDNIIFVEHQEQDLQKKCNVFYGLQEKREDKETDR